MGGSGGSTCMPENAQQEIEAWDTLYADLSEARAAVENRTFPLMAKGLAMQQAGVIAMETDPDILNQRIQEVDPASLR